MSASHHWHLLTLLTLEWPSHQIWKVEVVVGPIGRPGGIGRKNTSLLQQVVVCTMLLHVKC